MGNTALYYFGSDKYPFNVILKKGTIIMFTATGFTTDREDVANELREDIKAGNPYIYELKEQKAAPEVSVPVPGAESLPPAVLAASPGRTVPFIVAPTAK